MGLRRGRASGTSRCLARQPIDDRPEHIPNTHCRQERPRRVVREQQAHQHCFRLHRENCRSGRVARNRPAYAATSVISRRHPSGWDLMPRQRPTRGPVHRRLKTWLRTESRALSLSPPPRNLPRAPVSNSQIKTCRDRTNQAHLLQGDMPLHREAISTLAPLFRRPDEPRPLILLGAGRHSAPVCRRRRRPPSKSRGSSIRSKSSRAPALLSE